MQENRGTGRLWTVLTLVVLASFAVLLGGGWQIYRHLPPIPGTVRVEGGPVLFTRDTILTGQSVWRSMGGQQVGSIWGHGAYVAPDWSADWLHREAELLLDTWAMERHGTKVAALETEARGALEARLRREFRTNRFDPATDTLIVSEARAKAMVEVGRHYSALFSDEPGTATLALREAYALPDGLVPEPEERAALNAFFFWSAWVCATERPGGTVTYTNNWPPEPLIGNVPTTDAVFWSILSVVFLLAGVGALVWYMAGVEDADREWQAPEEDPLASLEPTPSMRATTKYFQIAMALFGLQAVLGVITAHYGVEGRAFFGFPLAEWLPYPVSRTWHVQLGVFWIATCFLATGLFVAPAIGGREPAHQALGVNVLFGALVLVVVGSMTGEWLSIQNHMGHELSFWLGHQGYEYVDLGRVWQIALYGGLLIWLFLMGRALLPALRQAGTDRQLVGLMFLSTVAIGTFYGAGLMWGSRTHLGIAEYWRWWVIHLWVEGFFEVFATCVLAFLFVKMGLVRPIRAVSASLFSTAIFLGGGIVGTFHHLYFSGTPVGIMALGASFSAMEVVPLVLLGYEAWESWRHLEVRPWVRTYEWPIKFFVGVSFWNLVGAGLFGFLINPPIALYYMQGLNTTPVHGHAALFGVYGLLSIGMMLFCLRRLTAEDGWDGRWLARAFWGLNLGLVLMIALSLLPVGLAQAVASMDKGMWWARSAEFLQQPWLATLRWMRAPGDMLFLFGLGSLVVFLAGLRRRETEAKPGVVEAQMARAALP